MTDAPHIDDGLDRGAAGRRQSHFTDREEPPKRPWWFFLVGALVPEAAWLIARLLESLGMLPQRDYLEFSEFLKFTILACAMVVVLWLAEVITSQGRAIRSSLRTVILFQLAAVSFYVCGMGLEPWGQIGLLEGHDGKVLQAEFSSDGSTVLTLGSEGTVRCWDAATGECLSVLERHTHQVTAATFFPDGERMMTASRDYTARIWRRRRPEWWWGVFYLWEFWLTAAFAGLFIWSVVRDRRALELREQNQFKE